MYFFSRSTFFAEFPSHVLIFNQSCFLQTSTMSTSSDSDETETEEDLISEYNNSGGLRLNTERRRRFLQRMVGDPRLIDNASSQDSELTSRSESSADAIPTVEENRLVDPSGDFFDICLDYEALPAPFGKKYDKNKNEHKIYYVTTFCAPESMVDSVDDLTYILRDKLECQRYCLGSQPRGVPGHYVFHLLLELCIPTMYKDLYNAFYLDGHPYVLTYVDSYEIASTFIHEHIDSFPLVYDQSK